MKMKCEAYECWCGNKDIEIIESVKNEDGIEIYRKLSGGRRKLKAPTRANMPELKLKS
jgi:hypothetical protein